MLTPGGGFSNKYPSLFQCPTMLQFFWQADLIGVTKFVSECLDVMLGADSDDQSQTSDQPEVAGIDVID